MAFVHVSSEMTAGDAIVGLGTLALALFTAWLALRTSAQVKISKEQMQLARESIEASDRPFVVPKRNTEVEGVKFEPWVFVFGITNIGRGPAVVEKMHLLDDREANLFDEPLEAVRALAADEKVDLQRALASQSKPPDGASVWLHIYYRSAAGTSYRTETTLEVTENGFCKSRGHRRTKIE
jgi:hypothetical protein